MSLRDYRAILLHLVTWSSQLVFLPIGFMYLMVLLRLFFWLAFAGAIAVAVALYTLAELRHHDDPKRGRWDHWKKR